MTTCVRIVAFSFCLTVVSAAIGATVTDVGFSQDPLTGKATVSYSINEPAIITVDVRTNRGDGVYASIGADKLRHISGEVNKLVTNLNTSVSATWPLDSMPEQVIGAARVVVSAWSTNAPPDYMAVSLVDPDVVRYYVSDEAFPLPVTSFVYRTEWLVMRRIPAAGVSWHMGTPENAAPVREEVASHVVSFTEDYYMGIFEYTAGQWWRTCNGVPTSLYDQLYKEALDTPCCTLSYNYLRGSVDEGINWPTTGHAVKSDSPIGLIRSRIGVEVDLPTEAQWEYACRAGCGESLYTGKPVTEENISEIACITPRPLEGDSIGVGWPGGLRKANAWGLYDMCGNQQEWCLDWGDESATAQDYSNEDPKGLPATSSVSKRVRRGGSWLESFSYNCRSAFRVCSSPSNNWRNLGFRLVAPCRVPLKAK